MNRIVLSLMAILLLAASAPPKGEAVLGTTTVTATVTKIDHTTREVTVRTEDGSEVAFVADDRVKNLDQVKVGDTIKALYMEALAYEVKKGGKPLGVEAEAVGATAEPGQKPAAGLGRQITATVVVTAIDPAASTVTFKGPAGNTRTIKVRKPEKLQGVAVGDAVDITYTEALAVTVEETPAK